MALKTYNPTTPGQRQLVMVDRSALYKGKPVKALTEGKLGNGGRNNTGRITVRFRGGGHKQAYSLAPQRLAAGDTVIAGNYVDVKPGNVMPLGNMPVGTIVHNIEMKIG